MLHTLVISISQNKRKYYACALCSSMMCERKDPSAAEIFTISVMRGANQLCVAVGAFFLPIDKGIGHDTVDFKACLGP